MLYNRRFLPIFQNRKIIEIGLAFFLGLLLGTLVIIHPYLPLPSNFQKLVLVIPFAFTVVMLFNNLEKLILFSIALGIPLNLDFSVIISPYARNELNIASGNLTVVALTELRVSIILIIVLVGYVLWLVEPHDTGQRQIKYFSSTSIPALGLIFISILSLTQAQDVQLSFFKIIQLVELFLVYFYLANHIKTKRDMHFFIIALMVVMLAESILMAVQWQTGLRFSIAGITAGVSENRAAGTLGAADTAGSIFGGYLLIVCAIAFLFPKRLHKIFSGICFVLGCIALISTGGRAAWGGFVLMILVFMVVGFWRGWVQYRSVVLFLLITLIIGAVFYPVIRNRLTEDDRGSAASRPMMFRLARNVIQASPSHLFLGVGANNYALVAHNFNTADVGNLGYVIYSSVHNAFLLAWAETGIFGFLCFLIFLATPLLNAWKHTSSVDHFTSLIALGLGCALLVMIIQMLVDPFIARPKTLFVWLLVSLIASIDNLNSKQIDPLVTRFFIEPNN